MICELCSKSAMYTVTINGYVVCEECTESAQDKQPKIAHPLPFGTKVFVDAPRHELTTAYLNTCSTVAGGGWRYDAVFVSARGRRPIRANVYAYEISLVITKNEDLTLRLLAQS